MLENGGMVYIYIFFFSDPKLVTYSIAYQLSSCICAFVGCANC